MTQQLISYEASVNWMRKQPQYAEMIELCYLDRDNLASAQRFAAIKEFLEAFYAIVSLTHFWRAFAQLLSPIIVAWVSQCCKISGVMMEMAIETGISWY